MDLKFLNLLKTDKSTELRAGQVPITIITHADIIPLRVSKETNDIFALFGWLGFAFEAETRFFYVNSALFISHDARTTPSSRLDFSQNHSSIRLF